MLPRKVICFDTEGTGLRVYHGDLAIYLAWLEVDTEDGTTHEHFGPANESSAAELRDRMCRADVVIGHNIKFDAKLLRRQFGINLPWERCYDTLLMARLANDQEPSLSLLGLSLRYLSYNGVQDLKILDYNKGHKLKGNYSLIPKDILAAYTMRQLQNTLCLFARWHDYLSTTCTELYRIEMRLPEVLMAMEDRGIVMSARKAKAARKFYEVAAENARKELYALGASTDINFNSTAQLAKFLEDRGVKLPKLQSGKPATSAPALLNNIGNDPSIGLILELRHAQKLLSTYVEGMHEEAELLPDGSLLVHPNYSQAGTQTGRLSASDPNLHNVPKEEGDSLPIKDMFQTREGYETFSCDYKSLQLVIAGGLSGDERMCELAEGGTLHDETTHYIFEVPDGSKAQRVLAKGVNFGMIFGAGVGKVAFMLAVAEYDLKGARSPGAASLFKLVENRHRDAAKVLIDKWQGMFPGLWKYRGNLLYQLEQAGFIEDPMGRRHHIPRPHAYAVVVSNVQGMEANLVKSALLDLHSLFNCYKRDTANLLLQVHDEVVFEVEKASVAKVLRPAVDTMRCQAENRIPVRLDVKCSRWMPSWGRTKEVPKSWLRSL